MWCHYQPAWEQLADLRGWLRQSPTNRSRAFCKLCKKELTANLSLLRKHVHDRHTAKTAYAPCYSPAWRRFPDLKPWLRRSPKRRDWAFCSVCNKDMRPMLYSLRKHAACSLHLRRAARSARAERADPPGGAIVLAPVDDLGATAGQSIVDHAYTAAGQTTGTVDTFQVPETTADDMVNESADHTGADSERQDQALSESEVAAGRSLRACSKYSEPWQRDPELTAWLRPSRNDAKKAFCLFCYKEMTAHLPHLRRHAASHLHQRSAAWAKQAETSSPLSPVSQQSDEDEPELGPAPYVDRVLVYNEQWECEPGVGAWLQRSPTIPRLAYCSLCRRSMTPKLAHLRRHAATARHQKKMRETGGSVKVQTVRTEHGDVVVRIPGVTDDNQKSNGDGARSGKKFRIQISNQANESSRAPTGGTCDTVKSAWEQLDHVEERNWPEYEACAAKQSSRSVHDVTTEQDWRSGPSDRRETRRNASEELSETKHVWPTGKKRRGQLEHDLYPGSKHGSLAEKELLPDRGAGEFGQGDSGGDSGATVEAAPMPTSDELERPVADTNPDPASRSDGERDPDTRMWLRPCPGIATRAYCVVCERSVTLDVTELRRHAATDHHTSRCAKLQTTRCTHTQAEQDTLVCAANDSDPGDMANSGMTGAPEPDDSHVRLGSDSSELDGDEADVPTRGLTVSVETSRPPPPPSSSSSSSSSSSVPALSTLALAQTRAIAAATDSPFTRARPYKTSWELMPELSEWLCRSPWASDRPFCRFCRREVTPKLAHLRRHGTCSLHRRNVDGCGDPRLADQYTSTSSEVTTVICDPINFATPSDDEQLGTCLICKHPLVARLNIFRTRTIFSKTLVACKLSKLVQTRFKEDDAEKSGADICASCASLVNQVDECEMRLVALEHEVKLKFKMPCPLSIHGREQPPANQSQEEPTENLANALIDMDDLEVGLVRPEAVPIHSEAVEVTDRARSGADPVQSEMDLMQQEPVTYFAIAENGEATPISPPPGGVFTGGDSLVVYREPVVDVLPTDSSMLSWDGLDVAHQEVHETSGTAASKQSRSKRAGGATSRRRPGAPGRRAASAARLTPLSPLTGPSSQSVIGAVEATGDARTSGRSYQCVFCRLSCPTTISLHRHMNEEHPQRLHPCPFCEKRFYYKSAMRQHTRTHQERSFTCEECGHQCAANSDLQKHKVFRHSSARDFHCNVCGRAFKVKWMMTRHRRRVHDTDDVHTVPY